MKTKLKKHGVKILTLIICLVSIVTALVIVPSADAFDVNLNYYRLYFHNNHARELTPYDINFEVSYDSPYYQKCTYIYYRLPNGQNLSTNRLFQKLLINIGGYLDYDYDTGEFYGGELRFSLFFDITDTNEVNENTAQLDLVYQWFGDGGSYQGLLIRGYNLHPDYPEVEFRWSPSYGNYVLDLWLYNNYISSVSCNKSFSATALMSDLCRYNLLSHGKTYAEGYNSGYDYGYYDGFGVGYDDGALAGWESGKDYGFKYGYDEARKVYDTSNAWADMKNLIFAIFDAPFYVISYSLDFDLFGINIAGTLIALISTALIVWILKIIIAKLF